MMKRYMKYNIYKEVWVIDKEGSVEKKFRGLRKVAEVVTCNNKIIDGPLWCIGKEIRSIMNWWKKNKMRAGKPREWEVPSLIDRLKS